jgi:hypothetical protein
MSPGGGGDCKERCNNCVLILISKDEYTNINMTKEIIVEAENDHNPPVWSTAIEHQNH